jgi:ATP-dependent DNA helicase RecQ
MSLLAEPLETHLAHFGLTAFRPGQREVIEAVLADKDCLCIMPTGGGKSLCYQLPSVVRNGTTLVVSPLIALMKDQVDTLRARGLRATFINSSLTLDEGRERLADMSAGAYDLVYIAPERLRNRSFLEAVERSQIQLLAVDEAHCISEWGHDFRPDYARIGQLRARLGDPQTIALTATATPTVRSDVMKLLRLREPQVFITGFARPNLHFEVRPAKGRTAKFRELVDFLEATPGAGIIYGATRKRCEEVAEELAEMRLKRKVKAYHAGLEPDARRRVQEEFMSGQVPVIVATNAFGMGIDKADLRFVMHFDMPGSLEAYYQEAGRAGRDGGQAQCVLLFDERDRDLQEWFIENSYPPRETIAAVYNFLRKQDADPIQLTLQEVKDLLALSVSQEGVAACEKVLEKADALERLDTRQNLASVRLSSDLPTLVDLLPPEAKTQRRVLRTLERIAGDVRHDYVFFPPGKLEAMSELDAPAIARALRELQRLEVFDYVPPFRGRAIRMKLRDVPFERLTIDFAELDRRKAAEFAKVDQVVQYARSRRCRQEAILDYFGDPAKAACKACDNCGGLPAQQRGAGPQFDSGEALAPPPPKRNAQLEAKTERVLKMALSGCARASGRAGKGPIAAMLRGSEAKKVTRIGLDQLSTFGLLSSWRHEEIEALLDALLRLRLIEQRETTKFRPIVHLTDRGRAVMRGEETADLLSHVSDQLQRRIAAMPAEQQTASVTIPPAAEPEPMRRESQQPAPVAQEPVQFERVQDDAASVSTGEDHRTSGSRPPWYWTWKLVDDGYTLAECCEIRRERPKVLLEHLLRAAEQQLPIKPKAFLSSDEHATLDSATRGRTVHLRTLVEELHGSVSPAAIELYLLVQANGSRGTSATS